ncbi:MAG: 4-(cytidine 5'-diphospho)-2-C-methyl-D-erythritol kinase [Micromonosporaceae bacterium]
MTGLTARAPAKLNLQLSVGPLRADGFHDLATVFHAVSLFDELTVEPSSRVTVRVEGEGAGQVPAGRANLAAQAAAALRKVAGTTQGAKILIRKKIPVAAGLAGGSADAAAALVACNKLWGAGLGPAELARIAASVGSDVPFSLAGGTAVGLGRGERLSPALVSGRYHWVLCVADGGLSTAAVYAECDRLRAAGTDGRRVPRRLDGVDRDLLAALRSGDPAAVGALLSNDLQPAALSLKPQLRRVLEAGAGHGALGGIVCGSGPTCAFLASGEDHALGLAAALAGAGVCRYVAHASGPVPGAVVAQQAGERPNA